MAKDICILDIQEQQGGICNIRCVFWLPIVAPYPQPSVKSAYLNSNTDPATSGIESALQAGTLIEEVHIFQFPTSSIVSQWTTVEAIILAFLNARKNYRAGTLPALPDPGTKFGVLHDSSTGWSA